MFDNQALSQFSELDYAIWRCVTRNQGRISQMTIKQLAEEAHVSTGSVLRFCKKAGCSGWSYFKLRYQEYLERQRHELDGNGAAAIQSFFYRIDTPQFKTSMDEAYQLLRDAAQVIFAGIGTSGTLGRYGARYFSNVGTFSLCVEDPWQPILQNLSSETVAVVLSESGTTPQTIDIANQLRERGSALLCITNNGASTLAKMADCCVVYGVPEIIVNKGNITTQIPVLYILETLGRRLYRETR